MFEPLAAPAARALIRAILTAGSVAFSRHARREVSADAITEAQALAVLRGGVVEPAELEGGSWRYRVRAGDIYIIVVAFRSEMELVVVTGWRTK